jgi:hypothetical protein
MRPFALGIILGFILWHVLSLSQAVSVCDITHIWFTAPATRNTLLTVCAAEIQGGEQPGALWTHVAPFWKRIDAVERQEQAL